MGVLKHFSGVVSGSIIEVHSSNDVTCQSQNAKRVKGAWPGSRDPVKCGALNANSSKTVKDTNFKFGTHAARESPDRIPENCFERGRARHHVIP